MDKLVSQASGHDYFHETKGSNLLLKLFDSHEFLFYYLVQKNHNDLAPFVPEFKGVYKNPSCEMDKALELDLELVYKCFCQNINEKPIRDPSLFIAMVNGAKGMTHPCTLDLKVGRQNLDYWATPERNKHIQERCGISTTGSHAIRLDGDVCWLTQGNELVKTAMTKIQGRSLTFEELKGVVHRYFTCPAGVIDLNLVERVKARIQQMYDVFSKHTFFSFYSSSILVIYDADDHSKVFVKLIDFGRCIKNSLIGVERDENLLEGLANMLGILGDILSTPPQVPSPDTAPTPASAEAQIAGEK